MSDQTCGAWGFPCCSWRQENKLILRWSARQSLNFWSWFWMPLLPYQARRTLHQSFTVFCPCGKRMEKCGIKWETKLLGRGRKVNYNIPGHFYWSESVQFILKHAGTGDFQLGHKTSWFQKALTFYIKISRQRLSTILKKGPSIIGPLLLFQFGLPLCVHHFALFL